MIAGPDICCHFIVAGTAVLAPAMPNAFSSWFWSSRNKRAAPATPPNTADAYVNLGCSSYHGGLFFGDLCCDNAPTMRPPTSLASANARIRSLPDERECSDKERHGVTTKGAM